MKRILFPHEIFYPSQTGGVANTIYWIVKNLVGRGFEPFVVTTDVGVSADIPRNKWTLLDGVRAIYVRTHSRYLPVGQLLISIFNLHKADIVHTSSLFSPSVFPVTFAARLLRKKMVISVHGELHPEGLEHSAGRKRIMLRFIKGFIARYPVYHATTDLETSYVKNVFGEEAKVTQIPNYLEIPPKVERKAEKYLLFLGRIHPIKGIDNLLTALARSQIFLRSEYILKIAGRGTNDYSAELRLMVEKLGLSEKVAFVGQVEGSEKQQLLANAAWTVLPSHAENFGLVVVESLAQSTPVIAARGTPWQSLADEQIGFWAENSPDDLANAIENALDLPPEEYALYRSRSRPFVEREFDIEKNIDKWAELYRSL